MADEDRGDDWTRRRRELDEKLGRHRDRRAAADGDGITKRSGMQGMAQGLKVASEFVAGIAVGALIGYGIDHFLGTRPFGLILFLLLGFAAGVLNVVRGSSGRPESGQKP